MISSPLQLKDCFFTKIHLEAKLGEFAEAEVYPLQTRLDFRKKGDGNTAVTLGIRKGAESKDTEKTYFFELEVVGFFAVNEDVIKKRKLDADKIIKINAPSLLYGSARELLCGLTSRGILPMYLLPSMSFIDMGEPENGCKQVPAKPNERKLPKGK